MADEPRHPNYGALREAHQQALDDLNQSIDHGKQPSREGSTEGPAVQTQVQQAERDAAIEVTARSAPDRPEGHYGDRAGWTDRGDMPSNQKSAVDMIKDHNEQRQQQHRAALDDLNQSIDSKQPGQQPDLGKGPERPNDIER